MMECRDYVFCLDFAIAAQKVGSTPSRKERLEPPHHHIEEPLHIGKYRSLHVMDCRQSQTPTVGLEPTTTRLRALRSAD